MRLGIDFGTSGARAIVIDIEGKIQAEARYDFEAQAAADWVTTWQKGLFSLIEQIPLELRSKISAIAIDGTSSTVLLCDRLGNPLAAPLLYNDARGAAVLETLKVIAPPNHTVLSATSSLAKLLWLRQLPCFSDAKYLLHQADWLAFLLHGQLGISDYHNALKLGYDVEQLNYPDWLTRLPIIELLPKVLAPGTPVANITST
jgi:xylulokinase